MVTTTTCVKDAMRRMLDRLPDGLTWEDLQYHIYVRQRIEAGLKDSEAGRTVPHERFSGSSRSLGHESQLDRSGSG